MTFYLESLGCAKNQVESELIIERLRRAGFTPSAEAGGADIILVNTCGFIEEAKQQSINTALDFRREYPRKKIVLTGCLAVRYAQELRESLTEVDGVYEKPDTAGLAAWLGEVCGFTCYGLAGSSQAVPSQTAAPEATRPLLSPAGSAYVRVADGCDNGCSFCAIPLIRGRLRSRGADEVAAECQALLARGVKEICLVAQDLAAYGRDRAGESRLASLLERITRIQGDFWIRLLYLHPDHFPYEILPVAQAD
ncbi:MAG: radical SAM protein, partial [Spirochaetaceae bacterium]|nr:radical SAM protein [Spirochaetaceae bacterium]